MIDETNLHCLPRQEDVTTIDMGSHQFHAVKVTPENRSYLTQVALSMYSNEPCRICGELLTMDDLNSGAVFAGYSADSAARAAHKACWEQYPSDKEGTPRPEWKHQ